MAGASLLFSLAHFGWGIGGMVSTLLMGLVWGIGFMVTGRKVWTVILAHSLAHVLLVMQLYSMPAA